MTDVKSLLNVRRQKLGCATDELEAGLERDDTDIEDEDILQDLFHEKSVLKVILILNRTRGPGNWKNSQKYLTSFEPVKKNQVREKLLLFN